MTVVVVAQQIMDRDRKDYLKLHNTSVSGCGKRQSFIHPIRGCGPGFKH